MPHSAACCCCCSSCPGRRRSLAQRGPAGRHRGSQLGLLQRARSSCWAVLALQQLAGSRASVWSTCCTWRRMSPGRRVDVEADILDGAKVRPDRAGRRTGWKPARAREAMVMVRPATTKVAAAAVLGRRCDSQPATPRLRDNAEMSRQAFGCSSSACVPSASRAAADPPASDPAVSPQAELSTPVVLLPAALRRHNSVGVGSASPLRAPSCRSTAGSSRCIGPALSAPSASSASAAGRVVRRSTTSGSACTLSLRALCCARGATLTVVDVDVSLAVLALRRRSWRLVLCAAALMFRPAGQTLTLCVSAASLTSCAARRGVSCRVLGEHSPRALLARRQISASAIAYASPHAGWLVRAPMTRLRRGRGVLPAAHR